MLDQLISKFAIRLQPLLGANAQFALGEPQQSFIASHLLKENERNLLKTSLVVAFAISLLTISSKISFFIGPVPITMQTMAVFVLALALGAKLSAISIASWLGLGALGMPVFAGPSVGFAYLLGPTGGYLAGFVVASYIVGALAERGFSKHPITILLAMVIGNIIIYAMGVAWLGQVIGFDKDLLALGVLPFLTGDLLKIILAMIAFPLLWRLTKSL